MKNENKKIENEEFEIIAEFPYENSVSNHNIQKTDDCIYVDVDEDKK